jgi:hypothetical protein
MLLVGLFIFRRSGVMQSKNSPQGDIMYVGGVCMEEIVAAAREAEHAVTDDVTPAFMGNDEVPRTDEDPFLDSQ